MSVDPSTLTLTGIFVAGLATSLHCAGMCGLLTCGLGIAGHSSQTASIGLYHLFRLMGYLTAGLLAGAIGAGLGVRQIFPGAYWLPWLLILLLIVIAFGFDRRLGAVPGLSRAVHVIRSRTLAFPPLPRAAVIGFFTPLLPCGPLYAILLIALASGSAIEGGKILLVFGFGAIPAIWVTQVATAWMHGRLNARQFQTGKQILAGLAGLSLLWHFGGPLWAKGGGDSGKPGCGCELKLESK